MEAARGDQETPSEVSSTLCDAPHLYRLIAACGGNTFACGGPCQGIYCIFMPVICKSMASIGPFPDLNCPITSSRRDVLPIR